MSIPSHVMLAAGLCLVQGCGQTPGREQQPASAGATSAGATSAGATSAGATSAQGGADALDGAGALAGSTASGMGGSLPAKVGGAGQGGLAGAGSALAAEAGAAGAQHASDPSEIQTLLDTYRNFTPQTPAPVSVSGYIFGLCRAPSLRETEFAASIHGDGRYLRDWANPSAGQGIASQGQPAFPSGAVIVKEKYAGSQAAQADLVAVALMIKRQAGFDPAHGDWDYAYYEPALGIVQTAEQTAYCAKCHAGAAATDFVYVDGLKP